MTDVRRIVLDAMDEVAGLLSNPVVGAEVLRGEDVAFDRIEMDSLTRFEVLMRLETALGLELDDDEVLAQGSLHGLVAHLEARLGARLAASRPGGAAP